MSIAYKLIGAFPNNVPVVVILLEVYINPNIVVKFDTFKLKLLAFVVITHICKPPLFIVVEKVNVKPVYGAIVIAKAVLIAVIKDATVV